jgi:hypothetical protein
MTYTPLENALLELFDRMPSETIAIRAQVSQDLASSVLSSVKGKVIQRHYAEGGKLDVPTTAEVYNVIETAVEDVDVQRLAYEKETTVDAVRRSLSCVLDQTRRLQGRSRAGERRAHVSNLSSLLGRTAATSYLGDVEWPAAIPEYVAPVIICALRSASTQLYSRIRVPSPLRTRLTNLPAPHLDTHRC